MDHLARRLPLYHGDNKGRAKKIKSLIPRKKKSPRSGEEQVFDISVLLHYWAVNEDPQPVKTVKHRLKIPEDHIPIQQFYCFLVPRIVQRKQHSKTLHGRPSASCRNLDISRKKIIKIIHTRPQISNEMTESLTYGFCPTWGLKT